MATAVNK